jgi:hypothetical protein
MKRNYLRKILLPAFSALLISSAAQAQCLDCGTGADGAYHATSNTTIAGGTYNFTSFTIDQFTTVNVTGPAPLVIYCSGPVLINGMLNASGGNGTDGITSDTNGVGGIGVAGGYNGGDGVYSSTTGPLPGQTGMGPGGGGMGDGWSGGGGAGYSMPGDSSHGVGGFGGPAYSTAQLVPFYAGSGGGGGSGGYSCGSGGGGAGGGIIEIHSCTSITVGFNASILANGGNGGSDGSGNCGGGGGGSGGTIFLLTSGTFTNNGTLAAIPGIGGASAVPNTPYYGGGANGKNGRIRCDYASFAGSGTMNPSLGYTTMPLAVTGSHTDETSAAANDGTATATPNGGVTPYTYLWMPGNQTSATATGLDAGTYTCTVTDSAGCMDTTIVTVGTMSGINAYGLSGMNITVYPNPAHDNAHIALTMEKKTDVKIEVFTLLGEKSDEMNFENVPSVDYNYNTSHLASGVYFFRITANNNVTTKKITVSH